MNRNTTTRVARALLLLLSLLLASCGSCKKTAPPSEQESKAAPRFGVLPPAISPGTAYTYVGSFSSLGALKNAATPSASPMSVAFVTGSGFYCWYSTNAATSGDDIVTIIPPGRIVNGAWQPCGINLPGAGQLPSSPYQVATTAALPSASSLNEGALAYVQSQKTGYQVVYDVGGNNLQWKRLPTPVNAWNGQATWHINSATGSDDNSCLTTTAPCATFAEVQNRLSNGGQIMQIASTVDIWFDAAIVSENINLFANIASTGLLTVHGTKTSATARAFTAFTARNPATNTPNSGTDAGENWTTDLGKLIVDTQSGKQNAATWIVKDQGGGVGRFGSFLAFNPGATVSSPTEVVPGSTDSYQVSTVTAFQGDAAFTLFGPAAILAGRGKFVLDNVDLQPIGLHLPTLVTNGAISVVTNSLIETELLVSGGGAASFVNVQFNAGGSMGSLSNPASGITVYGGMQRGATFNASDFGVFYPQTGFMVQGGAFNCLGVTTCVLSDVGVMDGPAGGQVIASQGANVRVLGKIWGSGGTAVSNPLSAADGYFINVSGQTWVSTVPLTASSTSLLSNGVSSTYAFDPGAGTFTAARTLTLANLDATIAGGGFADSYVNPRANSGFVTAH